MVNRHRIGLVVAAAALWALLSIWVTEALAAGVEPREVGFWRAAVGAGCFALHALLTRSRLEVRQLPSGLVLGVIGVALFFVALPEAVSRTGIGIAWVLLYTAPGFILVVAWLQGAPVRWQPVGLLVMMLLGVALVAGGGTTIGSGTGLLWGMVSGAAYASHYVVGSSAAPGSPLSRYAFALGIGALVIFPFVDWAPKSPEAWFHLVSTGVVSTYLPFLALAYALRTVNPTRAAMLATLEPVFATMIAAAAYGDVLGPVTLIGGVLILGAAMLSATQPATAASSPSPHRAPPGHDSR